MHEMPPFPVLILEGEKNPWLISHSLVFPKEGLIVLWTWQSWFMRVFQEYWNFLCAFRNIAPFSSLVKKHTQEMKVKADEDIKPLSFKKGLDNGTFHQTKSLWMHYLV